MRHKKHRFSLGVTREHRAAMLSNMGASLITHDRIKTTLTKAKALRPFIEKIITKAKNAAVKTEAKDALHLRRLAHADLRDEDALTLLFNEKYEQFANRSGGYTRIYKLGPRASDSSPMALIELIKADDEGYKKPKNRKTNKAKQAPKAGKPVEEAAVEAAPEPEVEAPKAETEAKG